jgi:hypothetical protein
MGFKTLSSILHLLFLMRFHPGLPKDFRTILCTTSTKAAVSIVEGSHMHVGIKESIEVKNASHQLPTADKIAIQVNTEGYRCSKAQLRICGQ